jgi:hypothetical protein
MHKRPIVRSCFLYSGKASASPPGDGSDKRFIQEDAIGWSPIAQTNEACPIEDNDRENENDIISGFPISCAAVSQRAASAVVLGGYYSSFKPVISTSAQQLLPQQRHLTTSDHSGSYLDFHPLRGLTASVKPEKLPHRSDTSMTSDTIENRISRSAATPGDYGVYSVENDAIGEFWSSRLATPAVTDVIQSSDNGYCVGEGLSLDGREFYAVDNFFPETTALADQSFKDYDNEFSLASNFNSPNVVDSSTKTPLTYSVESTVTFNCDADDDSLWRQVAEDNEGRGPIVDAFTDESVGCTSGVADTGCDMGLLSGRRRRTATGRTSSRAAHRARTGGRYHATVTSFARVDGGGDKVKQSRQAANVRERRRMKTMNAAFDGLRARIPIPISSPSSSTGCRKLTKVDTLKYAIEYIKQLARLVGNEINTKQSTMEVENEVDTFCGHHDELDVDDEDTGDSINSSKFTDELVRT